MQIVKDEYDNEIRAVADSEVHRIHNLPFYIYELRHEISKNVVCATSKASDQPAHMRSLIRAFAGRLNTS